MHYTKTPFATTALAVVAWLSLPLCATAQDQHTHQDQHVDRHTDSIVTPEHEITPADTFLLATFVLEEIELIRDELGKPKNTQPVIDVAGAAPREAYFQAVTLFRKTDKLCFEITRDRHLDIEIQTGEIEAKHVWHMINRVIKKLNLVKTRLGIKETSRMHDRDSGKGPSDVFRVIVHANRQLNLLLDKRFLPSDVFQQVTLAINYSSRLLAQFPESNRIPDAPTYQRRKHPKDVYFLLVNCYGHLHEIARQSHVESLTLTFNEIDMKSITPSDVYDIASVIVSELAFLHEQIANIEPPAKTYYAGRKIPSDVYQRAGMLEAQLIELLSRVNHSSGWLE